MIARSPLLGIFKLFGSCCLIDKRSGHTRIPQARRSKGKNGRCGKGRSLALTWHKWDSCLIFLVSLAIPWNRPALVFPGDCDDESGCARPKLVCWGVYFDGFIARIITNFSWFNYLMRILLNYSYLSFVPWWLMITLAYALWVIFK